MLLSSDAHDGLLVKLPPAPVALSLASSQVHPESVRRHNHETRDGNEEGSAGGGLVSDKSLDGWQESTTGDTCSDKGTSDLLVDTEVGSSQREDDRVADRLEEEDEHEAGNTSCTGDNCGEDRHENAAETADKEHKRRVNLRKNRNTNETTNGENCKCDREKVGGFSDADVLSGLLDVVVDRKRSHSDLC